MINKLDDTKDTNSRTKMDCRFRVECIEEKIEFGITPPFPDVPTLHSHQ